MIGRLNLELLEAFVAVVETGNITHAGVRLNRTQPCVSTQIRRLEERVGKPLLSRGARSLSLTPAGRTLYCHAPAILRAHEEAKRKLAAPELSGEVHVGLPEWYATARLQTVFCDFARVHPHVRLRMKIADSATLHDQLARNELNLAIALVSPNAPVPEDTVEEPLCWAGSPGLEITQPIPLILFPEPCPFREVAFAALASAGFGWYERITTTTVAAAQVAVESKIGLSVLPAGALTGRFQAFGAQHGLPELPKTRLAVYSPPEAQSETVVHLHDHLRHFLQTTVARTSIIGEVKRPALRLA